MDLDDKCPWRDDRELCYDFRAVVPKVFPLRLKSLGYPDSWRNILWMLFMSTLFLIFLFLSNAVWDMIAQSPKSVLVFQGFSHRLLLWSEMPGFSIDECIFFFLSKILQGNFLLLIIQFLKTVFFKLALAIVINLHWLNHSTQLCSHLLCLKLIKILKAHNKIKYT